MSTGETLEILNIIIGLLVVVVPSFLGLWIWKLKEANQELREEQRRMKAIRKDIYMELISPYISLFANASDPKNQARVIRKLQSEDYAKNMYEFCLNGSDEAVKALNKMRLYAEELDEQEQEQGKEKEKKLIACWGGLLLVLRRDLGEKNTQLKEIEMLMPHLTGLAKYA